MFNCLPERELLIRILIAIGTFAFTLDAQTWDAVARQRDDSLAAQKKAWFTMREMQWRSGTVAFRMRKATEGRSAIVNALKIIPGDEWLNSFRLRYPVPGAPAAASPASRAACGASPWWCDMLFALSIYRTGNYAKADSALTAGLAKMPDNVRCVWGDVAPLIPDKKMRAEYEQMPCKDRFVVEDRLWWLTDPLHTRDGNERRLEHFAREINIRLSQEDLLLRRTPGPLWALIVLRDGTQAMMGNDLIPDPDSQTDSSAAPHRNREGFINRVDDAYGAANPLAWSRKRYSFWEVLDTTMRRVPIGRSPAGIPRDSFSFVPVIAALNEPLRAEPSHWQLRSRIWYEYAISPIGPIAQLEDQHGYFRRGDSSRLVLATGISSIPFLQRTLNSAAMALSHSPSDPPRIARLPTAQRYTFSTMVSHDSMLVSVEIIAPSRGGARTRFGAVAPARRGARVDISDILLLNPAAASAAIGVTLESVLDHVLGTTKVASGASAALFWEIYGLRAGEQPTISVITTPEGGGGILGAVNIFAGARTETSTTYTDIVAVGNPIEGRAVGISLTTLRTGSYLLSIKVEVPGEPPVVSSRRIEIVR